MIAINSNQYESNIPVIEKELEWLNQLIDFRLHHFFKLDKNISIEELSPPKISDETSIYAQVIRENDFSITERTILIMALSIHIVPSIYDIFFTKDTNFDRGYTVFGGIKGEVHSGFIPTGETASFIICGSDIQKRLKLLECFEDDHAFNKKNIVHLTPINNNEPVLNGTINISQEYLSLLAQGKVYEPQYTSSFPAKRLTTKLSWDDAVFDDYTLSELDEVRVWIRHGHEIMQNKLLQKHLKKGFRILFHGPPGTGKTMTAALLGQETDKYVYQIDLSSVVSKYIGETEKNLASVFNLAENKDWILFFDEADALFGKRSHTQSSNDQFANQQIAYLLQRIEDYDGVVILATNFKDNIDSAFIRRFQSVVYFPKPKIEQRLLLWQKYFSDTFKLSDIDLEKIAKEFEITGGSIINVLRYCTIAAKKRNSMELFADDIYKGINKEYLKDGITI